MNNSTVTLKDIFYGSENPPAKKEVQWDKLESKIKEEIKGIKWTASAPELTEKVDDLLNIKVPGILIEGWKKEEDLQKTLKESSASPDETFYLELFEHTIKSEHHPYIEIMIKGVSVKKIEFLVSISFNLKGIVLKIKEGVIKEIQAGNCEIEGEFDYQDLTLAKKKLSPIKLPGTIQF